MVGSAWEGCGVSMQGLPGSGRGPGVGGLCTARGGLAGSALGGCGVSMDRGCRALSTPHETVNSVIASSNNTTPHALGQPLLALVPVNDIHAMGLSMYGAGGVTRALGMQAPRSRE